MKMRSVVLHARCVSKSIVDIDYTVTDYLFVSERCVTHRGRHALFWGEGGGKSAAHNRHSTSNGLATTLRLATNKNH